MWKLNELLARLCAHAVTYVNTENHTLGSWFLLSKGVLVLAALCVSPALMADNLPYTYTGDTTGAPTYTSFLSDMGHDVTFSFTVDTTGLYDILQTDSSFHPDLALYDVTFNPASPSTTFLSMRVISAANLHSFLQLLTPEV